MKIAMIAAMAEGRVIGKDNKMPWHLPAELQLFKRVTMGKPVVMGRKTFESIGRPLPGRHNIVLTRDAQFRADGVTVVHSLEAARQAAGECEELMIIGGATIYNEMLPAADRLYLTFIDATLEGDAWFPEYDDGSWKTVDTEQYYADEKNPYDYQFVALEKRAK